MTSRIALIPGLLIILLLNACSDYTPPLRFASNNWPGYQAMYVAEDAGYFTSPVKLSMMPSNTDVMDLYRNRLIDVAALTLDEALTLAEHDPDLRIFLITDISNGADSVLAHPDIPSLDDLRGKRIGFESTALGIYFLSRVLQQTGLSREDVTLVPVTSDQHLSVFENHQVDVILTFEPIRSQILELGGREIFSSKNIPGKILDVLVTRKDVIEHRREELNNLVNAWFLGLHDLMNNTNSCHRVIARRLGISPESLKNALGLMALPDRAQNHAMLSAQNVLEKTLEELQLEMLNNRLITRVINTRQLIHAELSRGK